MINFDHFKYNKASLPNNENSKKEFFKQLEQQFREELKGSESAREYFKNFNPQSIESFINLYASKKAHLSQYYQFYSDKFHEKENSELQFQKKAEEMLQLILQKKLFNIQLRWRAGLLEIDEVATTYDFQFWENHIFECPFIPPILRVEVDIMKEYLLRFDEDDEIDDRFRRWQDYSSLTEKNEKGLMDELPKWYDFYDSRMGTGVLLLLPDYKGSKEDFYLNIHHWKHQKYTAPKRNTLSAPYLTGFIDELFNFSKFFEKDKYFIALFQCFKYYQDKEYRDPNYDDLENAIQFLLTADRPVYPNSHLTWDKAIMAAAKEYKNTKIAEALDFVFEGYLMMKELGFTMNKSLEEVKEEYNNDNIAQLFRNNILKGRILNGEPEDFNY